ncbi:DNA polymerase III subunit beta [Lactococcus fujiensis]|uniref:Beta sliding clamp n=1 Tax=Lactococcus fujiensis JCM 16395 TaxID=1291764 RepID=A0A2A5RJ99_9LACT|nr:DNA polymerase III subunit beta [Lactococcus fujiensis]PCR99175.1 DNA polymerase III subunit beta [Lactococcus fujiensis JCM 16395]
MIKFTINKSAFQNALRITKQAIGSKVAIPALTKLKIVVATEGITLVGSNGQISIENFIPADNKDANMVIEGTGSILLEASFFESVVSQLPEVVLEFTEDDQKQVVLHSGKSEITLKGLDAEVYPRIQAISKDTSLKIKVGHLKSLFSETVFAVSNQENRPIFTGVHLQVINDNELKAVATDSHRMSQRILALDESNLSFDVILPSKSINSFKNVFTNDEEEIEIFINNSQMLFKNETISYYSRLIEGNYPDTNRLIPKESDYSLDLVFDVAELRHSMERARLLTTQTANGTVKLTVSGDSVITTANSPEVGSVHEEISTLEKNGSDLAISFNPEYLIDALKVIKSPEVRIRFISNVRPFTLQPKNDETSFIQLITPVRTN